MAKRTLYTVTTNFTVTSKDVIYVGKTEHSVCKSQIEETKRDQADWLFSTKADKNPQIISVTVVQN